MRILFDHGTPRGLMASLSKHTVTTAKAQGWEKLMNGLLLKAADVRPSVTLLSAARNSILFQPWCGRSMKDKFRDFQSA